MNDHPISAPAAAAVTGWGELRGEWKMPGVLRVLVAGQAAGAVECTGDSWAAQVHGLRPSRPTTHASADDALRAVLRSSWARRLGARAGSRAHWSDRPRRAAGRVAVSR